MISFLKSLLGLSFLTLIACSSSSSSEDMVGAQFTVVCRNEVQECYTKAQDLCSKGYLVINRVRGIKLDAENTEYRAIIRCKR